MTFRTSTKTFFFLLVVCTAIVTYGSLSSCSPDPTAVQAAFIESQELLDSLRTRANEVELTLLSEPDEVRREEMSQALQKLRDSIEEVQATRDTLAQSLDETGEVDPGGLGTAIGTFLPPPWNVIASVLVGGVGVWWKGRKTRVAFKKLVEGINRAKATSPTFAAAIHSVGSTIRATLGASAPVVDETRRRVGETDGPEIPGPKPDPAPTA